MQIELVATVRCSFHCGGCVIKCPHYHEFRAEVDDVSIAKFGQMALDHFRGLGWQCDLNRNGDLCPVHYLRLKYG